MALDITSKEFPEVLELPLYESVVLGTAGEFQVVAGLTQEMVEDLKRHSLDESDTELMKGTSDKKRFGEGSYEAWYEKKRYPFALVEGNKLAALIWFGPENPPEGFGGEGDYDTMAFRSYEPYRGKGLMTDFSRFVISAYHHYFPTRHLWLETNADNEAAKRLYEKLGFTTKGVRAENGRLVMTQN